VLRFAEQFHEIFWILTQLGERLPRLRDDPLYHASIPHFLSSGAYKFLVDEPHGSRASMDTATAFGFVTFYKAPMMERLVLAVEALWFARDDLEAQMPVWRFIATLARQMEFHGVCLDEQSVNAPRALAELSARGTLDGDPVGSETVLLQLDAPGIYSSFTDGPVTGGAFLARCLRIYTLRVRVDLDGVASTDVDALYRGEGRLANPPHWACGDLDELGRRFMARGFDARAPGRFDGTVGSQILQQGYVNQPTVSLTTSFDVAAYYATKAGTRPGAVVFTIDAARLRALGDVYDSYRTLARHCDWIMPGEFATLRRIVQTLGVLQAGRFLARVYDTARTRVEQYGHLPDILMPRMIWSGEFDASDWERLRRADVDPRALDGLQNAFETFWMFALGKIGSVDTIVRGGEGDARVESRPAGPFGYYVAFEQVRGQLASALEGATGDHRQPGWDLTAFGYIAKTCRDEEFFAPCAIPGECIVRATVVSPEGRRVVAER